MVRILIAESLHLPTLHRIAEREGMHVVEGIASSHSEAAFQLDYAPDLDPSQLPHVIAPYDGLVVRPKPVTAEVINAAQHLRLIVRGGAGLNSIDLACARECGVMVENTPGQNSISTAEFTFGLIWELLANRHIQRAHRDVLSGSMEIPEAYVGSELRGKKLGIVGLGAIGRAVMKRAQAFEMEVFAFSRSLLPHEAEALGIHRVKNLQALAESSLDVLSLHAPLNAETNQFIDDAFFRACAPGLIVINAARPQLINADALGRALTCGQVRAFAIDGDYDLLMPFLALPERSRGLFTHHIADTTEEAQAAITRQVLTQLLLFFREGKVINAAWRDAKSEST